MRAASASESFSAKVKDLSIQGIGLIAKEGFDSGTSLVIEGGPSRLGSPRQLAVTVRHATTLPNGGWLLGCTFSRYLTLADFEILA